MCVFIMYNLVHCCDSCKKLDVVSLLPVSSLSILIRINLVQFCCLCQNIVTFFKKVNSALGKHQTKFLVNQMQQTGIKHRRAFRKISWGLSKNFFTLVFFGVSGKKSA